MLALSITRFLDIFPPVSVRAKHLLQNIRSLGPNDLYDPQI